VFIYPGLPTNRPDPGKGPAVPIKYENRCTPEGFRGCGEDNKFTLSDTESQASDCPARSLVSITTNLTSLTFHFEFRPKPFCVGSVMNKLSLMCCFILSVLPLSRSPPSHQCFLPSIRLSPIPYNCSEWWSHSITPPHLQFWIRSLKRTKENLHVIYSTLFPHVWVRGCLKEENTYSCTSPLGPHSLWNWPLLWNAAHANYTYQGGIHVYHCEWNFVWSDGYTSGNNRYIETWLFKEVDTAGSS